MSFPVETDQELNDLEVEAVLADGCSIKTQLSADDISTSVQAPAQGAGRTTSASCSERLSKDEEEEDSLTPHEMAAKGELSMLQQELLKGVQVDELDEGGQTLLMWACANGQLTTVSFLLNQGANLALEGNEGESALLLASCYGHNQVVELLCDKGADINHADRSGSTCLMYAAFKNHASCVQTLLSRGADLTLRNRDNFSAFDFAVKCGNEEAQDVIQSHLMDLFGKVP